MGRSHLAGWTLLVCCWPLFPFALSTLPFIPQPDAGPAAEPSAWFLPPGGTAFMVPPHQSAGMLPDVPQHPGMYPSDPLHQYPPQNPSYPYPPQNPYPMHGHGWHTNPYSCSGVCYSEETCLRSGGTPGSVCRDGKVCCIFERSCNQATQSMVSFFRSPDFPSLSRSTTFCHHLVMVRQDVCALRLDFEEFHLLAPSNGVCSVDQFLILGGLQGPSYPRCGNLDKYSTLVSVNPRVSRSLGLLMIIQNSVPYRWNIRATQIRCSKLRTFREWPDCGIKVPPSSTTPPEFSTKSNEPSYLPTRPTEELTPTTSAKSTTTTTKATTTTITTTTTTTTPTPTPEPTTVDEFPIGPSTLWAIPSTPRPTRAAKVLNMNLTYLREADGWSASITSANLRNVLKRQEQERVGQAWAARQSSDVNLTISCDERQRSDPSRIIGGKDARPFEFPWQAAIFSGEKYTCSGVVITPNYVLTASHCFFTSETSVESLKVVMGDINITENGSGTQVTRRVGRVFFHSHFNLQDLINDMALVMLEKPVAFSYAIRPICMPNPRVDYVGRKGIFAGWGYTVNQGTPSDILQKLEVNIIDTNTCSSVLGNQQTPLLPSMICAAGEGCRSTCFGDSGGPLTVKERKGRTVVVGILSFGVTVSCAVIPNFPDVYTKVSEYFGWIGANIHYETLYY